MRERVRCLEASGIDATFNNSSEVVDDPGEPSHNEYVAQQLLVEGSRTAQDELVQIRRSDLELLYLKERAMDAIQEGITIADASSPDMPLIYINEGFSKITGYPTKYAKNKNCRFLQGEKTDLNTVRMLKDAIRKGEPCVAQITVRVQSVCQTHLNIEQTSKQMWSYCAELQEKWYTIHQLFESYSNP